MAGTQDVSPRDVSDDTTPWQRGARAQRVRPDALRALEATLTRAAAARGGPAEVDFEIDAKAVVLLPACRAWVRRITDVRPAVTAGDAEAAVLSAYVACVERTAPQRALLYLRDVARRLRPKLSFSLKAIGVLLHADELRETVLEPMSWFFLESVRTLEADPNRLRTEGEKRIVKRPFGFSPSFDAFGGSLSLLVTRQTRKRYWSNAFTYSPLGYWLRSCGLAQLVPAASEDDAEAHDRRRHSRLVATRRVENALVRDAAQRCGEIVTHRGDDRPSRRMERAERRERSRRIVRARTKDLWMDTLTGGNPRKLAVLLGLAGLTSVPGDERLSSPETPWLDAVVRSLLGDAPHRNVITANARVLLAERSKRLGVSEDADLTPGYVSTILTRLKDALFDGCG